MKKFECNRCDIYCKLEVDEENPNPTKCVYNGLANWREVNEETEVKEKVKDIVTEIPQWIIFYIANEHSYACKKHPNFPSNEFEQLCIIQGELGKAVQALNKFKHHGQGVINEVNIRLVQTIVTCIRTLEEMDKNHKC